MGKAYKEFRSISEIRVAKMAQLIAQRCKMIPVNAYD